MGRQITQTDEETSVTVGLVRLPDLARYERNARTHPQDQIEEIKASIRAFGFTNPIPADLDDGGVIAAGHGRHMALEQMLDAEEDVRLPNGKVLPAGFVPVIDCSAWTETQRRAYQRQLGSTWVPSGHSRPGSKARAHLVQLSFIFITLRACSPDSSRQQLRRKSAWREHFEGAHCQGR